MGRSGSVCLRGASSNVVTGVSAFSLTYPLGHPWPVLCLAVDHVSWLDSAGYRRHLCRDRVRNVLGRDLGVANEIDLLLMQADQTKPIASTITSATVLLLLDLIKLLNVMTKLFMQVVLIMLFMLHATMKLVVRLLVKRTQKQNLMVMVALAQGVEWWMRPPIMSLEMMNVLMAVALTLMPPDRCSEKMRSFMVDYVRLDNPTQRSRLYKVLMMAVLADEKVDSSERRLLSKYREDHKITEEEHEAILLELGWTQVGWQRGWMNPEMAVQVHTEAGVPESTGGHQPLEGGHCPLDMSVDELKSATAPDKTMEAIAQAMLKSLIWVNRVISTNSFAWNPQREFLPRRAEGHREAVLRGNGISIPPEAACRSEKGMAGLRSKTLRNRIMW
ncbi:hypothetical protein AK812_SmicGene19784 [Symbiodinium microadriaticum]|uniref:Uncharacterized protein n=1 Tax=Symbiodinium microadriaticum TaxID=2951 RepID=A0A1Q9DRQ5_SYMMI|nr:hypothetical protein AK812_SmicGene19784 [Symbiodinium microadriaticum]